MSTPRPGRVCSADGLWLQFGLEVRAGVILQVEFASTTCVTLMAYAERIA